ncbi:hypothetical protein [Streptomyces sp. NPDC002491]
MTPTLKHRPCENLATVDRPPSGAVPADLLPEHTAIGVDFALVEECGQHQGCGDYAVAYASRAAYAIEYGQRLPTGLRGLGRHTVDRPAGSGT